jgi:hypothetical protein
VTAVRDVLVGAVGAVKDVASMALPSARSTEAKPATAEPAEAKPL